MAFFSVGIEELASPCERVLASTSIGIDIGLGIHIGSGIDIGIGGV